MGIQKSRGAANLRSASGGKHSNYATGPKEGPGKFEDSLTGPGQIPLPVDYNLICGNITST